jgi:hypothetical protein
MPVSPVEARLSIHRYCWLDERQPAREFQISVITIHVKSTTRRQKMLDVSVMGLARIPLLYKSGNMTFATAHQTNNIGELTASLRQVKRTSTSFSTVYRFRHWLYTQILLLVEDIFEFSKYNYWFKTMQLSFESKSEQISELL